MAIAFVQYDDYWNQFTGSTTVANDTALNTTTGNLIVVVVQGNSGTGNNGVVTGITDTAGNTYTKIYGEYYSGTTYSRGEMWYTENIDGNANNVTTATFTGSCNYRYISVSEYSGVATSYALLDFSFVAATGITNHTSGNATSENTGDLIVGGWEASGSENITVGTDFTALSSNLTSVFGFAEYLILGAAGDYAATLTTGSTSYKAVTGCAIFANADPPAGNINPKVKVS